MASRVFIILLSAAIISAAAEPDEKPVNPTICSSTNQGACDCSKSAEVKTYVLWPKMAPSKAGLDTNRQRCFHKFEPSVSTAQNKVPVLLVVSAYGQGMITSLNGPGKAGEQYGYAVIGIGSTDKDGAGGFGLEFPNDNVINHANPTPCAHEDSRDHAYIKAVLDFIKDSNTLDESDVYVMGFSQNSMYAAYISICFASRVSGVWQGGSGLARTGMAPVVPGKQGQCSFTSEKKNGGNCCREDFCDECEYWPVYPRTCQHKIVDCIMAYTDDKIACGTDKNMFDAMVAEGNDARLLSFSPSGQLGGHSDPEHKMAWITGCLGIVDSCSESCETAFKSCIGANAGIEEFGACEKKLAEGQLSPCRKSCAPTMDMLTQSQIPVITLSEGKFGTQTELKASKNAPDPECDTKPAPLTSGQCTAPQEVLARISANKEPNVFPLTPKPDCSSNTATASPTTAAVTNPQSTQSDKSSTSTAQSDTSTAQTSSEACSTSCMSEVTGHCVTNIQCKKNDVFTLAAAARKCQEEINAQSTGIKLKCPAPCTVAPEVLNKAGTCDGKTEPNTTPKPEDSKTTPKPNTKATPKPDTKTTPKPDTKTTPKPDTKPTGTSAPTTTGETEVELTNAAAQCTSSVTVLLVMCVWFCTKLN